MIVEEYSNSDMVRLSAGPVDRYDPYGSCRGRLYAASVAGGTRPIHDAVSPGTGDARQTSCLSNVKQLGLAALMCTQDYDEISSAARMYGRPWWGELLMPYMKNTGILICTSTS